MGAGGSANTLDVNQTTTTPETQTPETTSTAQPPMSGGKGAGRVSPTVESRPMFQNQNRMFGQILGGATPPTPPGTYNIQAPVTPPPSTGGGGKGAGRVSPTVESRPKPYFERNPGLDNPVFRGLVQRQNQERFQPVLDSAFQQARNQPSPPVTPPTPSGGGGKGAGRVSPIAESRPMFQKVDGMMVPTEQPQQSASLPQYQSVIRGFPSTIEEQTSQPVLGQQLSEQPQQSITGMNMNTGSTNSMPAPQSAIFKQGGLVGLMRRG